LIVLDDRLSLQAFDMKYLYRAFIFETFKNCLEASPKPFEQTDTHSVIERQAHFFTVGPITDDVDIPRAVVVLDDARKDDLAAVLDGPFYVPAQESRSLISSHNIVIAHGPSRSIAMPRAIVSQLRIQQ